MIPQVLAQLNGAFPYGHSFCRIKARLDGEQVWIDARTKAECRAHKAALIELARRHGLPMLKINNFLNAAAMADFDTAPVDLEAEQFAFQAVPGKLGEVPAPDDNVDFIKAIAACQRDAELCASMLGQGASARQLLAISDNQRRWCEFWAMRDADPQVRLGLAAALAEHDRLAEANTERLQEILSRRLANGSAN